MEGGFNSVEKKFVRDERDYEKFEIIKFLFFGKLKGWFKDFNLPLSEIKTIKYTKDLIEWIAEFNKCSVDVVNELRYCMIAINDDYINKDELLNLKANDEISLLPPVSGG